MKNYKAFEKSTLFEAVKKIYPDSSNTTIRDFFINKRVYLDSVLQINPKSPIEKNQTLTIYPLIKKIPYDIEIIFEDRDILVINKPDNLLSVPLDDKKSDSALSILRKHPASKDLIAVHRIDRTTSGIMMFAKNLRAAKKLNLMFKNHAIKREYLGIVAGSVKENEGTWKSYLAENTQYYVHAVKNKDEGQLAITHFTVIKRSKKFTYLKLNLETGRKHQIRVHCKDAGHPILGDKRYSTLKSSISRMCLHSYLLEFSHPITGKKMSFTASIPAKLNSLDLP